MHRDTAGRYHKSVQIMAQDGKFIGLCKLLVINVLWMSLAPSKSVFELFQRSFFVFFLNVTKVQ